MMTYLIENPGMIYFLHKSFEPQNIDEKKFLYMAQTFLDILESYVKEIFPEWSNEKIKNVTLQTISAILLPLIFSFIHLKRFFNFDVHQLAKRREFITIALNKLLS